MRGSVTKSTYKVPWLMEVKDFCSQASIVGLRYVANQSASMFRRSVWVLLLLAGAAFTAVQIVDQTAYYFSYPTSTNIRVEHVPEMRFPTVTICNENRITLSGATSLGKKLTVITTSENWLFKLYLFDINEKDRLSGNVFFLWRIAFSIYLSLFAQAFTA